MKTIKVLGMVALATLTAMAFVGASSAMAESTALCKIDAVPLSDVCPEANRYAHVHNAVLGQETALLLGAIKIQCDLLFLGDVQNANNLGNPLEILGHLTYPHCVLGSMLCTWSEVTGTDTKVRVLKEGHELATVTMEFELVVKCGFFINCTYNGEGLAGHLLGPLLSTENGEIRLEEQTLNKVKGFCPESAKLDLLITPLETIYIAK